MQKCIPASLNEFLLQHAFLLFSVFFFLAVLSWNTTLFNIQKLQWNHHPNIELYFSPKFRQKSRNVTHNQLCNTENEYLNIIRENKYLRDAYNIDIKHVE